MLQCFANETAVHSTSSCHGHGGLRQAYVMSASSLAAASGNWRENDIAL
jgi:hypothetical protein